MSTTTTQAPYSPELYAAFLDYSKGLKRAQYLSHPQLKVLAKPKYFRGYCLAHLIEEGFVKLALEILHTIPPEDIELPPNTEVVYRVTMDNAVRALSLELLKLLHERSIGECTKNAMDTAAKNGDMEIIRFLHENRTEGCSLRAFKKAKKYKHDDVLAYLEEHCQADKAIERPQTIAKCDTGLITFYALSDVQPTTTNLGCTIQ